MQKKKNILKLLPREIWRNTDIGYHVRIVLKKAEFHFYREIFKMKMDHL